jgi:predicted 2-oxoglutarate/Fe(II)-dependent dioxygenase YbiX
VEVDAETLADVEQRLDAQRDALAGFFRETLAEREGADFLRYDPGAFYGPHRDYGVVASWPGAARRRVSLVVFLNDGTDASGTPDAPKPGAFTGGALRLYMADGAPLDIVPRQGLLVAFSSTTIHEVLPVVAGTRDVIVDWWLGAVDTRR